MTAILRVLAGAAFAWCVASAVAGPELPLGAKLAALAVAALTAWRADAGLLVVVALAPAGALAASPPARPAELLAWTFLATWLLRIDRPLSEAGWPRAILIPAGLFVATATASWLTLSISGAAGVPPGALPQFIAHSIPDDYLIFSSPGPEMAALLQIVTGAAILLAAVAIARDDARLPRRMAWTMAASLTLLALATTADVARQWANADYGGWFLLRYVAGERYSLHLSDLNAAGSLYVLGLMAAVAFALFDRRRQGWAVGLAALTLPALWLAGSRSAGVALIGGVAVFAAAHIRWRPTRAQLAAVALPLVIVVLAAGVLVADWRTDVGGSAARAVSLRSQFSETSARMVASAPLFGVGVGRYFTRSAEFMPEELRALYGNENAHNYFAQQFAELGIIGGGLFVCLIAAGLLRGWEQVRRGGRDAAMIGLFGGASVYLLTCVTGHPLLVVEAALPFWAAFGVVAAAGRGDAPIGRWRVAAGLVALLLVLNIARALASYGGTAAAPAEQGFHTAETAADGTSFRWMTRQAVTYIPDGPGFLRLTVQAPVSHLERLPMLETSVAGRVLDRREIPRGAVWVTYDVPVRQQGTMRFRRVDLRANEMSMEEVRLGDRPAQRPIALMVARIQWIPIR